MRALRDSSPPPDSDSSNDDTFAELQGRRRALRLRYRDQLAEAARTRARYPIEVLARNYGLAASTVAVIAGIWAR
jgi:hypothetical protein